MLVCGCFKGCQFLVLVLFVQIIVIGFPTPVDCDMLSSCLYQYYDKGKMAGFPASTVNFSMDI